MFGIGYQGLTHSTRQRMRSRGDHDQTPDGTSEESGRGGAGGREGVRGSEAEGRVGERAGEGRGRGGEVDEGDTVNVRESHDWLGSRLPTWMPGTNMDLHLRWEYRVSSVVQGRRPGDFIVAADVWQQEGDGYTTSKRFHAFPSAEVFFTEYLPRHGKRCYYEVLPEDAQVKLYFDIEWVSDQQEGGRLPDIVSAIEEVVRVRWPQVSDRLLCAGRNIWTGGRRKGSRYKNSFHVVYDTVLAPVNHGALRRLGRDLAQSTDHRLCVAGASVVDGKVYNRNQQYRLPRCWKIDDAESSDLRRVRLTASGFERIPCDVQAAVQSTVTGPPSHDAVLISETDLDELGQVAANWCLHTLQMDGGWVEGNKVCGLGPLRCPWAGNVHADGVFSWKFNDQLATCTCSTCDAECEFKFDEERKRTERARADEGVTEYRDMGS